MNIIVRGILCVGVREDKFSVFSFNIDSQDYFKKKKEKRKKHFKNLKR